MEGFSIRATIAAVIGTITALLGGWDNVMEILVILIIMDYLTGVALAIKDHKLNSEIGHKGLLKKAMIFFVVILAAQLDRVIQNPANLFRTTAALFYIANEGLSVLENIGMIGVPLPTFLTKLLEQLRDTTDKGDGTDV